MKKRIVALILVITLVWGTIGDQLPFFGRSGAAADGNEQQPATQTDLGPDGSQNTDQPSEAQSGTAPETTGNLTDADEDGEDAEENEQPQLRLMAAAPAQTRGAGDSSGTSGNAAEKTLLESLVLDKINELFNVQGILNERIHPINTSSIAVVLRLGFDPYFYGYDRPLGLNKNKSRWTFRK